MFRSRFIIMINRRAITVIPTKKQLADETRLLNLLHRLPPWMGEACMKILCYGDSNTYGYDGTDPFGGRLPDNIRWPELLGRSLGCEVLNCGLNGRCVPHYPRTVETDLRLLSRAKSGDLILVMLGTNDLLCGAEAENIAEHMKVFLSRLIDSQPGCKTLLAAPPPAAVDGEDCSAAFLELAEAYYTVSQELGISFVDTTSWQIPVVGDGIHFSERGHMLFALKMSQAVRMLVC